MLTKEQNRERMRRVRAEAKATRAAAGADAVEAARRAVRWARAHMRDAPPEFKEKMLEQLKEAEVQCRALGVRPPRTSEQLKAQTARKKAKRAAAATLAAKLDTARRRLATAELNLISRAEGLDSGQRHCVELNQRRLDRLETFANGFAGEPGRQYLTGPEGAFESVQDVRCYQCMLTVTGKRKVHATR